MSSKNVFYTSEQEFVINRVFLWDNGDYSYVLGLTGTKQVNTLIPVDWPRPEFECVREALNAAKQTETVGEVTLIPVMSSCGWRETELEGKKIVFPIWMWPNGGWEARRPYRHNAPELEVAKEFNVPIHHQWGADYINSYIDGWVGYILYTRKKRSELNRALGDCEAAQRRDTAPATAPALRSRNKVSNQRGAHPGFALP